MLKRPSRVTGSQAALLCLRNQASLSPPPHGGGLSTGIWDFTPTLTNSPDAVCVGSAIGGSDKFERKGSLPWQDLRLRGPSHRFRRRPR
jgi:hypothetical protein